MQQLKKARGAALLTALFIMTLVAIVAVAMSTKLQLDIYRTRLVVVQDKLYLTSQAVMFWAMDELKNKSTELTKANKQGEVLHFPHKLQHIVEPVQLTGVLYDMHARFNVNNLLEKKYTVSFLKLLNAIHPDLNTKEQLNLILAIQNWIAPVNLNAGKDEFTSYYLAQKPAYYPGHQLLRSISELRLVRFMTAPLLQKIQPYITVLPETTAVNINTAPLAVLMSLGKGLNKAQASELISKRQQEGIKNLKDIAELLNKLDLPLGQITIDSQYFLSVATVTNEEYTLKVYTLLKRSRDKKGEISVNVVRESFNTL